MYSCSYSMLSLFLFYQATYTKLYIFLSQCYAHMNTQMYIYWLIVTNTHIYTYKEKTFEHSNLHTNASVQILIKNKTQLNVLKYFFIWFLLYKKKITKVYKIFIRSPKQGSLAISLSVPNTVYSASHGCKEIHLLKHSRMDNTERNEKDSLNVGKQKNPKYFNDKSRQKVYFLSVLIFIYWFSFYYSRVRNASEIFFFPC